MYASRRRSGASHLLQPGNTGERLRRIAIRELKYRAENSVNFQGFVVRHLRKRDGLKKKERAGEVILLLRRIYETRNCMALISCLCLYRVSSCKYRDWRRGHTGYHSRTTGSPADDSRLEEEEEFVGNAKWLNYWCNSTYILFRSNK